MKATYVTVAEFKADYLREKEEMQNLLDKKFETAQDICNQTIEDLKKELKRYSDTNENFTMTETSCQAYRIANQGMRITAAFNDLTISISENVTYFERFRKSCYQLCHDTFSIEVADEIVGKVGVV